MADTPISPTPAQRQPLRTSRAVEGRIVKSLTQSDMDAAQRLTIQEVPLPNSAPTADSGTNAFMTNQLGLFYAMSKILPPYWSPARDAALGRFWREVNILSGAVYALVSKLTTIPFHFEARDTTIQSHVDQAERLTVRYTDSADYGAGWINFFSRHIESLLVFDNGAFMELIGEGPKDGAIEGPIISISHLDSQRATRTGDPEFPVLYQDVSGKQHKLHWTRVAFHSQLPNPRATMLGVGFSAISRSTSYAQNMLDIATYKEEKLGSRPSRSLMLVGGGLSPKTLGESIDVVRKMQAAQGHMRYAPNIIVGDDQLQAPTIELIDLASLPDGYDEQKSTTIAVAAIALGFGIDMRELWPASETGSTRADALLSHIKSQGKGPGHILAATQQLFESRILPPHIKMIFDFQDDTQDKQQADIRDVRALSNERLTRAEVVPTRALRQNMLRDGDLTEAQFSEMELADGRLPSGEDVTMLFFSNDPVVKSILTIEGVAEPLDTFANDPTEMQQKIMTRRIEALRILARETRTNGQRAIREAIAALDALKKLYEVSRETMAIADPNAAPKPGERGGGPSIPAEERRTGENKPSEADASGANRNMSRTVPDAIKAIRNRIWSDRGTSKQK